MLNWMLASWGGPCVLQFEIFVVLLPVVALIKKKTSLRFVMSVSVLEW